MDLKWHRISREPGALAKDFLPELEHAAARAAGPPCFDGNDVM